MFINNCPIYICRYYCDYCDTYLTHDSVSIHFVFTCTDIYIYRHIENQDNLSDIRSGNLEKLSDRKKICLTE